MGMGSSRFESFQILLDEDPYKTLFPWWPNSASGVPVYGPNEVNYGLCWTIDARVRDGRDKGSPGDRYLVKLMIAGKWRSVVWEKVYSITDMLEMGAEEVAGSYYVSSNWNSWSFEKLQRSEDDPDLYFIEVVLLSTTSSSSRLCETRIKARPFIRRII